MKFTFTKMQGAGNDFVLVNGFTQEVEWTAERVRAVADRHCGVGCDQILIIAPSENPQVDFDYRIFNADGTPAQMCGNGARCVARFVKEEGIVAKDRFCASSQAGRIEWDTTGGEYRVNLGAPKVTPESLPFVSDGVSHLSRDQDTLYQIRAGEESNWFSIVSMGNPHVVKLVGDVDSANVQGIGEDLQHHPAFPERVNVGFLQVLDRSHVRLRVFERGVGETPACGTGACAAVVAGIRRGALDEEVQVDMPGGSLTVAWQGRNNPEAPVWLSGPAERVFEGSMVFKEKE